MHSHASMNRVYRIVWNTSLGVWQAVGEVGKGAGKGTSDRRKKRHVAALAGMAFLVSTQIYAAALPSGGVVSSGSGTITQQGINTLNITQNSNKMAIDWQSFSVGKDNTVNFIQPSASSIALNRVMGNDVSSIQGAINANGQVFLINPNGVLFSTTAQVNVGGLVASTRNITNEQFNTSNFKFEGSNGNAIINQGNIKTADGGYVVIIAAKIENTGNITANNNGTVGLASGNLVTVDMGGPVKIKVEQGAVNALISNGGAIQADAGHILLTAKAAGDLAASVINNTGIIRARGLADLMGKVEVIAEGGKLEHSGSIEVSNQQGIAGEATLTAKEVTLTDTASIRADGRDGGGKVQIGGSWQNTDQTVYQATKTTLASGSVMTANATNTGNGGHVVAWSDITKADSLTAAHGRIEAKGGSNGGNGGQIETSGSHLSTDGIRINAGAEKGMSGLWLLDPYSYTINAAAAANIVSALDSGTSVTVTTASNDASYGSSGNASDTGQIVVSSAIAKTAGGDVTLTLKSARDVFVNAPISSTVGKLNLVLWSDYDHTLDGGIRLINNVTTNGGHLWAGSSSNGGSATWNGLTVGNAPSVGGVNANWDAANLKGNVTTNNGDILFWADSPYPFSTGKAGIVIQSNSSFTTGSGNITLLTNAVTPSSGSLLLTLSLTGTLTIAPPSGNAFSSSYTWNGTLSGSNFTGSGSMANIVVNDIANLGGLSIGQYTGMTGVSISNTNHVTTSSAVSITGAIGLYGGNITINAGLTATGSNSITLNGTGNVTDGASGYVSAANLLLSGGAVTLDSTSNAIDTLAASGISSLIYTNANALTIGTTGSTNGVTATGMITVGTVTGDLTLSQNIASNNTSTSAITLNAGISTAFGISTGGNIVLSGSPTVTTGTGGRANLYTGSISGSTGLTTLVNSGSGNFRYNSDETTTNYITVMGSSGIYAIYREQPIANIANMALTMIYGDSLPSITATGTVNGDNATYSITGRINSTSGNVAVTGSPYSIATDNLSSLGYSVTGISTGTLSVNQKAITATGITASNKIYDTLTTANLTATSATITNAASSSLDNKYYTGDTVNLVTTSATGAFADKNVGTAKGVTVSGLSLSGADAGNYTVSDASNATANITAKSITATGITASNKVYDALTIANLTTTSAALTSGASSSTDNKYYMGDTVNLVTTSATGAFADKNVGTTKSVMVSGLSLSGADASNYNFIQPSLSANITPVTVTLSASKVYDGTTNLTNFVTLGGFIGGETLSYTGATASDAHAATSGKYLSAITLVNGSGGGLASNYTLPTLNAANAPVTITPATLTPILTNTGVTKTYDGTNNAPDGFIPTWNYSGFVSGDTNATLGYTSAAYDHTDASGGSTATKVTVSGLSLMGITGSNGSDASDYTLSSNAKEVAASITKANLTITANNDAKFVTTADPIFTASYSGFVNGETSSALTATPTVVRTGTDTVAGTYHSVLQASGAASDNYDINYHNGDFTIVPSNQLLVRTNNISNIYGTTTQYAIQRVEYYNGSNVVRLDDASVLGSSVSINANNQIFINDGASGTATFTLAPQGATTSTAGFIKAGSYQLATLGTVTENSANFSDQIVVIGGHTVTQKSLIPSVNNGVSKIYDRTTAMNGVTIGLTGKETGDIITVTGNGTFDDRNAGNNKSYTISSLALNGADASNYYLSGGTSFSGNNGTITPKLLTVSYTGVNKIYDGSTNASVTTSDDRIIGDVFTISHTDAFSDKNVGIGKTINITGVSLSTGDAANYIVATTGTATANITQPSASGGGSSGGGSSGGGSSGGGSSGGGSSGGGSSGGGSSGGGSSGGESSGGESSGGGSSGGGSSGGESSGGESSGGDIINTEITTAIGSISELIPLPQNIHNMDTLVLNSSHTPITNFVTPHLVNLNNNVDSTKDTNPLIGINGISNGLVFLKSHPEERINKQEISESIPVAGLDSVGFMKVIVVKGGICLPTQEVLTQEQYQPIEAK